MCVLCASVHVYVCTYACTQAVLKKELSSFEAFVSDSLSLSSPGSATAVSSALFYKVCECVCV